MTAERSPVPGTISIRPSSADIASEPDRFYSLLDELRNPDTLSLRKIAELSGDNTLNPEPNILRKIKSRTLSEEARRFVLRHIFEDEQILSGSARRQLSRIDDALYFAVLNHFGISEASQDNARALMVGTYKFWSLATDGEKDVTLGKLTCYEDPATRAVKTMVRMRKPGPGGVGIDWTLRGYLISIDGTYLTVSRREGSGEVRIVLYPRSRVSLVGTDVNPRSVFAGTQNHVVHMDGVTLGIDRRSCFLTPVHVSLVDDVDELRTLDAALDVVSEGDPRLPPRVLERLRRYGPLKWL